MHSCRNNEWPEPSNAVLRRNRAICLLPGGNEAPFRFLEEFVLRPGTDVRLVRRVRHVCLS